MLALLLLLPLATLEVTSYGAVANDATSDSAAFRSAFAAAQTGDVVHAGCGVWDMPRIDNQSAVYLYERSGITFDGDGACTILRMAGGTHTGDYHVFHLYRGGTYVFSDFACDGNRSNIVSADEQTHCFNVNEVVGITMHDLDLSHAYGDGARFIGDDTTMTGVWVHDVTSDDNGRSGLAFAGCGNCLIERYTATNISDSGIDTEPPVADMIDGFTVRDSYIGRPTSLGAAAFSMSNGDNFLVEDTEIWGPVHCSGGDNITMDHVSIHNLDGGGFAFSANEAVAITMNRVNMESRGNDDGIHTASIAGTGPTQWSLTNVKITVENGVAFELDGGGPGGIAAARLRIRTNHPTRFTGTGVRLNSTLTTPNMAGLVFDVDAAGVAYGATISRGVGNASMNVTLSGTMSLPTGSTGVLCSYNGSGLTFNAAGLNISATTSTSGCP